MKFPVPLLTLTTLLAVAPIGCSPSDSTTGSSSGTPSMTIAGFDLSRVEGAFASATGAVQEEFNRILSTLKGGDYSAAMTQLQQLAHNAGLSTDQKSAIESLIAQVKSKGGDLLKSASETAGKAVDQAKEAAGKAAGQATDAVNKAAADATDAAKKATGNLLPK